MQEHNITTRSDVARMLAEISAENVLLIAKLLFAMSTEDHSAVDSAIEQLPDELQSRVARVASGGEA